MDSNDGRKSRQKYKNKRNIHNSESTLTKNGKQRGRVSQVYNAKKGGGFKNNKFKQSKNQHFQQQFNEPVGQDTQIDDDTFHYFKRVAYQLQETFPTSEDREIFIRNALEQTEGRELKLSRNKITSYVVQLLLEETKDLNVIKRFMKAFRPELSDMCVHHCGSHLVQCLLYAALQALKTLATEVSEVSSEVINPRKARKEFLIDWVLELGNLCCESLHDLVWDNFGSHVLRTLIEVLGGKKVDHTIVRSKKSYQLRKETQATSESAGPLPKEHDVQKLEIPEFSELLGKFVDQLNETDLTEWIADSLSSAYLQTLILATRNGNKVAWKRLFKITRKHIFPSSDPTALPIALTTESGTHLAEKVIEAAGKKQLAKIWNQCLKLRITDLSHHQFGNYVLQKFVNTLEDSVLFGEVFSSLIIRLEEFLESGYPSILKCIAEACVRLNSQQGQFMKGLMQALHCYEPERRQDDLVPLLLYLTTYEKYQDFLREGDGGKLQVSIHGSVLLQHVSTFQKPIKVVKSMLSLNPDRLKSLLCDVKGSHAFDAFVKSPHIGEKNREKFIQHMKVRLFDVTCDKYGSRFMDNLWDVASLNHKFLIAEELVKNESRLKGNYYGKFFAAKCSLYHFKHRLEQWRQMQAGKGVKRGAKELELQSTQPIGKLQKKRVSQVL